MQAVISYNITITDPSDELLRFAHNNLVITNPEYIRRARMHKWLGNVSEMLYLYELRGNELILPYGVLEDVLPLIKDNCTTHFTPLKKIDLIQKPVPLYDYQEEAVEVMLNSRHGILQSPTASGKTQMGIAIMQKFGLRALWLTHTQDLLQQSLNRAKQFVPESLIGTVTGGKVDIGKGVTFATVQTMCRLDLEQYRNCWDVIIVDECHRCSGTPTAITQFYKVLNNLAARYKYGLSATVHRSDGTIKATYALLGGVKHTVTEDKIADKIVKVGVQKIETGIDIDYECLNTDGTINYPQLMEFLCTCDDRNELIAQTLVDNADYYSLILSDRLNHLTAIMNKLPPAVRAQAVMIHGKMTGVKGKAEREAAIESIRQGKKRYLFATYSLAKEGLDIPRLERLYLATPQKDYAVITQSIGRIARQFEGKEEAICFDFVDAATYLQRMYLKRRTTYNKNGCYYKEVKT